MSFNIALSGLDATNTELNTISHNIANASTYGFKGPHRICRGLQRYATGRRRSGVDFSELR